MDTGAAKLPSINSQGAGIKTGEQFLASLCDGREVWYKGRRVANVTAFPAFEGVCQTLRRLYGLQWAPETLGDMTFIDDDGVRVSASYLIPETRDQLIHRRRNHQVWGRETFGMMGRNPDFCGGIMIGLWGLRDQLGAIDPRFKSNVEAYLKYCQRSDICLTHGLHDPNMDKTLRPSEDPDRCLRIVEETAEGYIVRGARYATLAPFANEILVYPSYMLNDDEDAFAIWFAAPMNTPGVRTICRDSYAIGRTADSHPLSVRFDEQDALVIFDDVLVPHDRVFLAKNATEATRLYRAGLMTWASYAGGTHLLERYKLFVGVAHLVAETAGIADRPRVLEELGELVTHAEMQRLAFDAMEHDAVQTLGGLYAPKRVMAARAFNILISERMVSLLEHIGTGALIFNQTDDDIETPELAPLLAVYGRGKDACAADRQKLVRLAFELSGEAFGSRQQLYERLHSGDPYMWIANAYRSHDKSGAVEAVNRLLGTNFEA